MASLRRQRVRELLKREIGEILRQKYPLPQFGLLTVVDIQLSNDLKNATIYVGGSGDGKKRRHASRQLSKDRAALQQAVAAKVVLKYIPHLRFVMNTAIEQGDRVLDIIDELERANPGNFPE